MPESYRFHEVRKGEIEALVGFAGEHGCAIQPKHLRHHLSLAVEAEDKLVAVALSTEQEPGHIVIEIVVGDQTIEPAFVTELADRCLRKVQAQDIASARLHSPDPAPTEAIWSESNWLERIEETPPPEEVPLSEEAPAAEEPAEDRPDASQAA